MRKYEIMYILKPDLAEEARKAEIATLHGILTGKKAAIDDVSEWGLRDLAYEIDKLKKGYYVVVKISTETTAPIDEFRRLSLLDSNVLRFLITTLD